MKNLTITKWGVSFVSYYRHFIYLSNAKFIIIDKQVFIKQESRRLVIKNVDNVEYVGEKLFFSCFGRVEMLFDNQEFYRYFNVIISSDKFRLKELRYNAAMDIFYHPFQFEKEKNFKFYIKIVKNILRVELKQKEISVKANKYFLPFQIIYKLNGKIRKVNFNFK